MNSDDALRLLDAALARRAALLTDPQTTVARLVNGAADGLDGLVVEKLGDVLIAQLHEGRLSLDEDTARAACAAAAKRVGARAVYRKVFPKDRTTPRPDLDALHREAAPWIGEPQPAELAVREHGLTFLVHPYDGYATGLFLDHRAQRQHVRTLAAGRRVLNAFAYTCGFTVAAALGGAAETVSVDVSRKYLEWGKRNLAVNGVALDGHWFICSDIFDYYRRATRQSRRFDLVVLDPPSFARLRRPQRNFSLTEDLPELVAGAVSLLDGDGFLVLSVNHRGTSEVFLERAVVTVCRHLRRIVRAVERFSLPGDFSGDPEQAKAILAQIG